MEQINEALMNARKEADLDNMANALRRQESAVDSAKPQSPSRGRLVLLEDNASVRAATELFLTLEGYETRSAGRVAEVETLLADLQPGDVLISDYHLEGRLTGLDVLQQLRVRKNHAVPAVLLSGDLQSMMRLIKTAIPNCRFLGKPVDTAALIEAIEALKGGA
jgi:DNA-binding NtrC family response regulator